MSINGKVALVTGAGQGIGRAIALRLAKDGANIAVVELDEEKAQAVAREVGALGRKATHYRADVSNRDEVYAAIDHAERELGRFDIMVNNAGIAQVQPLLDVTPEEVDRIFKINVEGVLWETGGRQEVSRAKDEGKDHRCGLYRWSRGLRDARRLFCNKVCGTCSYAGGSEGVRQRWHHRQRIQSRCRRHRYVG